ncbi:RrF2 family transcriptional regulator [Mycolicibacterium goodii]|uniref:RrF2 family transcriptional regulator n=1 Tax=Mycolicibacterium goodii TaxID=134601 RepID=UPI00296F1E11
MLTYLAGVRDNRPVTSPELAGSVCTSPEYVRRVMIPLRTAGIVSSTPGANGGWRLAQSAESITLAEIWHLTRGTEPSIAMHAPDPSCMTGRGVQTALTDIEHDVADAVTQRLQHWTIAALLERVARQARP